MNNPSGIGEHKSKTHATYKTPTITVSLLYNTVSSCTCINRFRGVAEQKKMIKNLYSEIENVNINHFMNR